MYVGVFVVSWWRYRGRSSWCGQFVVIQTGCPSACLQSGRRTFAKSTPYRRCSLDNAHRLWLFSWSVYFVIVRAVQIQDDAC